MKKLLFALCAIALLHTGACQKAPIFSDTPESESKTRLLAGLEGQKKSWKLTKFIAKEGANPEQDLIATGDMPSCSTDNVYSFSKNAQQSYTCTEGASKCATEHADSIEVGGWAISQEADYLTITTSQEAVGNAEWAIFNNFAGIANADNRYKIITLSTDALVLEKTITHDSGVDVYTLHFVKQ